MELFWAVGEHELDGELLLERVERHERVGVMADAGHYDAAVLRDGSDVLREQARHADAVEHDRSPAGGSQLGGVEQRRRRQWCGPARQQCLVGGGGGGIDDDIGAGALGECPSRRGQIGGDDGARPAELEGGDDRETDRAAADDERDIARFDVGGADGMHADRQRFGERSAAGVEAVGDLDEPALLEHEPLTERARVGPRQPDQLGTGGAVDEGDRAHQGARLKLSFRSWVGLEQLGAELVAQHDRGHVVRCAALQVEEVEV